MLSIMIWMACFTPGMLGLDWRSAAFPGFIANGVLLYLFGAVLQRFWRRAREWGLSGVNYFFRLATIISLDRRQLPY